MLLAIVAQRRTATNVALAAAAPRGVDARILTPEQAATLLQPGAVALGRLDVADGLDGVEDGLWALGSLAARGVRVLNRAGALLAAHDKLLTARVLQREGLPHPRTKILHPGGPVPDWEGPLVVKPRFGSWGRDVARCDDEISFRRHLRGLEHRLWFQRHGALLQELVPPAGADLRVVVAGGVAVGAISRVAAAGEWRTNIGLGGTRVPVEPPEAALELAVRAAASSGAELLGVDLLPDGNGGHTVLELNGAVDFTREYRIDADPFVAATAALVRAAAEQVAAVPTEPPPYAATGSEGAP
ncbi:MAG: ATP-grasp domain-containing protein [Gaiellaceae bacterium]